MKIATLNLNILLRNFLKKWSVIKFNYHHDLQAMGMNLCKPT